MPRPLGSIDIPADALEKVAAKDHYADLTDEERAEEELPPRETAPKEEAKPADGPPADDPDDEEEGDEESGEDEVEAAKPDDSVQALFDEIAALREEVAAKTDKPAPETPAQEQTFLKELLEDDDPRVRAMGEMLQKQEQRLQGMETRERKRVEAAQANIDDKEMADLRANFTIDGKPITNQQVELIQDYLLAEENKPIAPFLSFEETARRLWGRSFREVDKDDEPRPNGRPVKKPATDLGRGQKTATIVDAGASGGAPTGPWKPRPGETINSALDAAGAALLGVRRH